MLDPSAYVKRIKIIAESSTHQLTDELVGRITLERLPNYKHPDGRIYASRGQEPYFAVSVSPLNPGFQKQIEPGILPVVEALLQKNYLPISSCQGHRDSASFVRIVFGSSASADEFVQEFGTMEFVNLEKLYSSANVVQWWDKGKPKYRSRNEVDISDRKLEIQDINFLYKRNYTDICYVDLTLYQMKHSVWNFAKTYKIVYDMRRNKTKRIQKIADRILSMKDYEL